jgi:hypothetical protein
MKIMQTCQFTVDIMHVTHEEEGFIYVHHPGEKPASHWYGSRLAYPSALPFDIKQLDIVFLHHLRKSGLNVAMRKPFASHM